MDEIHYLLGNSCNLNCDFCFWDARMPDVALELKKKIIDEIVKSGIRRVTLSGGEPLCTNNFIDVLKYMKENNIEIILHSNGLKIDERISEQIAEFVSRVSLTLDAIENKIQIKMRKNNDITSHTVDLIKILNKLKVSVNIKTLVTKINKNEIERIGKVLYDLPIKYWSLLEFIPVNRGKNNVGDFMLDNEEFENICRDMKIKFPELDIRIRKFSNSNNNYCFIAPNGDVYTHVNGKGDVLVDNINSNSLKNIIKNIEKK